MERYDYYEAVKADVIFELEDLIAWDDNLDLDDWSELYDKLFICDGVTGNASGSYTFNAWIAEENVCHNLDLLGEALTEFGCDPDFLSRGAEAADVTIRCYVLGQVLDEAIEEIKERMTA